MRGRELKTGETFEGYRIERLLGAGGMGEVYQATHLFTEREVALKIILAERLANVESRELMRKEARVLCKLKHPNIVSVITAEHKDDGTVYIAMELLKGVTLRRRIHSAAPLPVAEALLVAIECGKALAYGHKIDIVHRDIKPENIFIDHEHTVKVLDYGIAKFGAIGIRSTRSDRRFGTPAYSAPEQLSGGRVGAWSDIFALGVCLYEMLTGRHPLATGPGHEGLPRGPALALAQEREPPKPIVKFMPEFAELSYVLEPLWIALRKEPGERYRTMEEFIVALTGARDRYVASVTTSRAKWPVTEPMIARISRESFGAEAKSKGGTAEMEQVTSARLTPERESAPPSSFVVRSHLPALIGTAPERADAARRLGEHDEAKARSRLLEGVGDDPDARVRVACAESLAVVGDKETLAALRVRLDRESDELARTAVFDAVKHLSERFHEPIPEVITLAERAAVAREMKRAEPAKPVVRAAPRAAPPALSRTVRSAAIGAAIGIPAAVIVTLLAVKFVRPTPAAASTTDAPLAPSIVEPSVVASASAATSPIASALVEATAEPRRTEAPPPIVDATPTAATAVPLAIALPKAPHSGKAIAPRPPPSSSAVAEPEVKMDSRTPIFEREP